MSKQLIVIFGGTFDPIHNGHLQLATDLTARLPLTEIRFLPCRQPLLKKTPQANAEQRLAMLNIALPAPIFTVDKREIVRNTPSYMVTTLTSLRKELGQTPLALMLGMDAFITLPQWHQWQRLIELAHLIVINRPNYQIPQQEPLASFFAKHYLADQQHLTEQASGYIICQDLPPMHISSSQIRQQIVSGHTPKKYLPAEVWCYIQEAKLYAHTHL